MDFPLLKALRLASRQYAYMPEIMKILFTAVRFVASPEHVRILGSTDLFRMRPYVKEIVMVPTRFSWNMTLDTFEQIVLTEPVREFCEARICQLSSTQELED